MTGAEFASAAGGGVLGSVLVHLARWLVARVQARRERAVLRSAVVSVPREADQVRAVAFLRAENARLATRPPRAPDLPC